MKTAKSTPRQKTPDPDVSPPERPAIMVRAVHYSDRAPAMAEQTISDWQALAASLKKAGQCS